MTPDEYLKRSDEEFGAKARQASFLVSQPLPKSPDEYAQSFSMAKSLGLPTVIVDANYKSFAQRVTEKRNETILKSSPVLTEWVGKEDNYRIAADKIEELSWWDGFWRGTGATAQRSAARLDQMGSQFMLEQAAGRAADRDRSFGEILQDARTSSGLRDMQGNPIETWTGAEYLSAFGRWIDARYADLIGTDDEASAADFAARVQESRDAIAAIPKSHIAQQFEGDAMVDGASFGEAVSNFGMAFLRNPLGGISWALETAGESGPQLAAAAATTILTRNPVAGAAVGGAGSYATERYTSPAEFLEEKGIDLSKPEDVQRLISDPKLMEEAASRGVIRGLVIGAFDMVSMGVAGRSMAGNPMVEALAQGAAQSIMGSAGEYTARVAAGQEIDWNEVIAEGLAEIATTPVDMGIAGRKFIRQRRDAERSGETAERLGEISQQAQASTMRERSPEKFREFVERALEGGEVENVFVPAETFAQYFQDMGVDPYSIVEDLDGVTRDDLDIALAGGGDLRIPTATYAAKMAGTEHDAFLMEHMRFDPDEMTARQAAEFNEKVAEIRQEAWELSEQLRQQEEQFRTFEQEIYDTMVSRLREAGRSTEVATTEAMLYPAFYRVMAERSGMTVDEFMARYPLPQVRGERPEGMQFKDVDALTRTLAEARARRDAGIDRRGMSLLEFIDDHGGINDPGGELRARDAEVIKRGRGKKTLRLSRGRMAAVRDMFGGSGKKFGLDDVAQAAIEAGYMADNPIVAEYQNAVREGREVPNIGNALLEAIDRELRGEPQFSSTAPVDQAAVDTDAALEGIDAYLSQLGVGLDDDDATIRAAVEADQNEGRQYSQAAADVSKDLGVWRGKLADLLRGKLPDSADLRVGNVPAVLRALGVRSGQMVFRGSKIRRVIREHADVGNSSLLNLPALLADPALVYEEVSKESDLIVVTDNVSATGAPVVVAIKSEGTTNNDQRATVVLTVYPLDRGNEKLAEIEAAGRILYLRDKEVGARFELTGANSLKGLRTQPPSRRPPRKILSAEDVFKGKGYKQPGDERGARGSIQFPRDGVGNGDSVIRLFQTADLSTMLHESGHYFLTVMQDLAARGEEGAAADVVAVKDWWRKNAAEVARDGARAVPDAKLSADDVIAFLDAGSTGDLVKDAAVDVGMQEQWARAFEAYLMEGKAPSVDLRGAFEKFRAWLISIYRRLAGLNVRPSEELRAVFDRMLATDNEIAEARERSGGMEAALPSAEAMGLSQEEYDRFLKLRAKAEDESKARLLKEIMAPIKREREKWYKDERAKVREEVEREVNAARYFRAIEWMGNRRWIGEGKPEQMPDIRLSKDILVQRYGAGILDTLPRGRQTVYAIEGGVDPDDVAGWFGFDSGDEMVRAMETAPKRVEAIEAETDKRMRELHGDVLRDGEVEAVALDAVHSERHTEWVAAELKAIAEVADVDVALTAKEARHTARQTISRMRVRDAMASNRFLAAERRAGEEAARLGAMLAREAVWMNNARRRIASKARAAMRGDGTVDAPARQIEQANRSTANYNETVGRLIEAKRRQLLNHALYMEARKAAEEVQTAERYVAGLSRKAKREQIAGAGRREKAQIDYLSAIDELLERYDFRKLSGRAEERRGALNAFVERMKAEGRENQLAIPESVLSDAARRPYKTLAVEELRGVVDTLKNLEHMALRWNELITSQRKREFEEAQNAIVDAIQSNKKIKDQPWAKDGGFVEAAEEFGSDYLGSLYHATTILRGLDGYKDMGPVYDALKSDIDEASYSEREKRAEAAKKIDELYSAYSPKEQREMGVKRFYPELGKSYSKWNLIAMALNMGNEGNLARLTNGRAAKRLTLDQVEFVKTQLDARDADFVQGVWDLIGSFKPEIAARERRLKGTEPAWVDPTPVVIGGKKLPGGYYPIKYDSNHGGGRQQLSGSDADILQTMMKGGFVSASTKDGHLKARAEGADQSLLLDVSVIGTHLSEVIHDLTHGEAVVNAFRLLTSPAVKNAFYEAGLQNQHNTLRLWVIDAGTGQVAADRCISRALARLRSGFAFSKLAWNVKTALMQPLGIFQSAVVVGKKNLARTMVRYLANPPAMAQDAFSKSRILWERRDTFNKDLMDAMSDSNIVSPSRGAARDFINDYIVRYGMAGMTWTQLYTVDVPTWAAAYEKGMQQFDGDDAKAISYADQALERAQGSGIWSNRSGIERGTTGLNSRQSPYATLLTTLGSYFFAKTNLLIDRTNQLRSEPVTAARSMDYAFDIGLMFVAEALTLQVLSEAFKWLTGDDDDEDDESFVGTVALESAKSLAAGLPVIRDLVSAGSGFDGGTYDGILSTVVRPMKQALQGELDSTAIKSAINLSGMLFRLPSSQANKAIDAWARDTEGEDVSPLEYFMGRQR